MSESSMESMLTRSIIEGGIDVILPPLYPPESRGGLLPRSPISLISPMRELSIAISKALSSGEDLLEYLEESYSYSRGLLWLRSLQWMGLTDPEESFSPFVGGLKQIEINQLPLLGIVKELNCSTEFKVCISPFLSFLLPTPFRKIVLLSLSSKVIDEMAWQLMEMGNASERMIAIQHIRSKEGSLTDLIFLLKLMFSTSIVRRGKKSDEGGKLAYLREQIRGEWRRHPCFGISPLIGSDLVEAETFISGSVEGIHGRKTSAVVSFCSKLSEDSKGCLISALTETKLALPEITRWYSNYYDLKLPSLQKRTASF
ncbi:MAG: hypothetical protein ACP5RO_00665 [Fervidicoccaceae archaeon]